MATLRTSLFSTLAIVGFATMANAQCDHAVDGIDTFGDGWNGATLTVNVNAGAALSAFTVAGAQTTGVFVASPGDAIDTVYANGTFDNEVFYDVYGGDASPVGTFPTACNLLGSDGDGISPVGLAGLVGDCAGAGACPALPPVIPANDDCTGAITISGAYQNLAFDMTNATDGAAIDYLGFCDFGGFGDEIVHTDIWYIFTPDNDGCHYMSTLNQAGFDTRLSVHASATCPTDGSTVIACVDDEIQPIVGPFEAGMDVDLVAGTQYYIQLGTFQGTTGAAGTLTIADGSGMEAENNDPGGVNLANPTGCAPAPTFPDFCNGDGGDGMGCTDCPCGNNNPGVIGGCLNSAGTAARLIVTGTATATGSNMAAPLRVEGSGFPPGNSVQLTSGNAAAPAQMANPCFGMDSGIQSVSLDGLRCAVMSVLRHGVRPSDANGDVGVLLNGFGGANGFFNYDAFMAGQTKYLQAINRDDAAQVCLTGQNTSQGVEVQF